MQMTRSDSRDENRPALRDRRRAAARVAAALAAGWLAVSARAGDDVVEEAVAAALRENPQIETARAVLRRAEAVVQGTGGFWDPRAAAGAGWASPSRAIPGVPSSGSLAADAVGVHAGVEKPLAPGLYAGAGAEERYLTKPDDPFDSLYQTVAGVQLRIPLLRDRGFRQWRSDQSVAMAGYEGAAGALLRVVQDLRRETEDRCLLHLQAAAYRDIARAATARAERLLAEAEELVKLQTTPSYQIFPARLEVASRREEQVAAESAVDRTRSRLAEMTGTNFVQGLASNAVDLVAWAIALTSPDGEAARAPLEQRGAYLEALAQLHAEEARRTGDEDDLRPDLSLRLAGTFQGEDDSSPAGTDRLLSDPRTGAEIALVWSQPLGSTAAKARLAETRALIRQRRAESDSVAWRIAAERLVAAEDFRSAQKRLQTMRAAVQDARDSLAAEEERFRLGEGTSRQVLDAQKDLTAAVRRQNDIAADVLRARSAWRYAIGAGDAKTPSAGDQGNP